MYNLFLADIFYEVHIMSAEISYVFFVWGYSFQPYGALIPMIFVAVVGTTIGGAYAVFMVADAGKDMVGA